MKTLVVVVAVCGCNGSEPEPTPAKIVPPAAPAVARQPAPAVKPPPTVLADDVAAIYPEAIHVLRKGETLTTAPHVIKTPKRTDGPAVWQNGELFVGLKGGDIAHLVGTKLTVIELPAKLKKLPKAAKGDHKREHGFAWTHDDGLVAGTHGEVWLNKCTQWYKGDADGCDGTAHIQLAPAVAHAGEAGEARGGAGLPSWPTPEGFAVEQTDEGVTCVHGTNKIDIQKPGGKPTGIAWLTEKPPRLIAKLHFDDESGEVGDRDEVYLSNDCSDVKVLDLEASTEGVYAFVPHDDSANDRRGHWFVVQDGIEVLQFPSASNLVLGHADGHAMIPH